MTYNQKNQKIYSFSLRVQKGLWGEEEGGWYDFGPAQASQKKVAKVSLYEEREEKRDERDDRLRD